MVLNPRKRSRKDSVEQAIKIFELNKQTSQFKRRKRLLREALIENGVSPNAAVKGSIGWLEQKADELGLIVRD